MKHQCAKCRTKVAQWFYMPTSSGIRYLCDDCVGRGCSCNIDPNTGEEYKDEQGRLLPCCEWESSEEGWDVEEDNDN